MEDYKLKIFTLLLELMEKFETFRMKDNVSKDRIDFMYSKVAHIDFENRLNNMENKIKAIEQNTRLTSIFFLIIIALLIIMCITLNI